MHPPIAASTAPAWILNPDPPSPRRNDAVHRVIEAFHRAIADYEDAGQSMWKLIEAKHIDFLEALRARRVDEVSRWLSGLFQTNLIWGLGHVSKDHAQWLRQSNQRSHLHLRFTDALVSLAEAVSTLPLRCIEQEGIKGYEEALHVNVDDAFSTIERQTGLDISFPQVGGAVGFRLGKRLATLDSIIHSYTLYRLQQIGASRDATLVEIGGGYGCLAALASRAGLSKYTILDLPWVNALQGYFLIMTLPPNSVQLYGEDNGVVSVLPHWHVHTLTDRSIDYFVNTDSLPEMAPTTAAQYISDIARTLRGAFLSINQEAGAQNTAGAPQNKVAKLVSQQPELVVRHRSRAWMRQGYVEEVFTPRKPPQPQSP